MVYNNCARYMLLYKQQCHGFYYCSKGVYSKREVCVLGTPSSFFFEKRAPLFKFTSQTARTWARKQFICVIGMYLTKMAAGKKANGSFLQLQGLEGSDLPSAKLLAAVTELGFARFAIATYNDIHDYP